MGKKLDDGAEVPEEKVEDSRDFIDNIETLKKNLVIHAVITKLKYDAFISQGFSKEQALELCK